MKTLLVVNDGTPQSNHAAKFALMIAQGLEANIIMANACKSVQHKPVEKIFAFAGTSGRFAAYRDKPAKTPPIKGNSEYHGFKPEITEVNISGFNEAQLAAFLNKKEVWMIIKGGTITPAETTVSSQININSLINKARCPVMIVPLQWQFKQIERLVYIADLRYCPIEYVRFLAVLARPWHASISIANHSLSGLPNMCDDYAKAVFNNEVCTNVKYDRLILNNIREKDLAKAVDIIINDLHNDVLVLAHRRFHFQELIGPHVTEKLPGNITVPLLVFPS